MKSEYKPQRKNILKEALKRILPPPVRTFNREMDDLKDTLSKELDEKYHTVLSEAARCIELQRCDFEKTWMEYQSAAKAEQRDALECYKSEIHSHLETMKCDIEKRLEENQSAAMEEQRRMLECYKSIEDSILKLSEQNAELYSRLETLKHEIIDAVRDSRDKAIWETIDKLESLSRQGQEIFWYWQAVCLGKSLANAKESFFRAMPKAEGPLRQIQTMELYLLKGFVQLCSEHGLTYWLSDGSLLGAMRHHGFVPWDDDMDISMPRSDFERLRELLNESETFRLVDYYCLVERRWFSKITKFVDISSGNSVFIDIFPYDFYDAETQEEVHAQYWDLRIRLVNELEQLAPSLKRRYKDVIVDDPEDKAALDAVFAKYVSQHPKTGRRLAWSIEIWDSQDRAGFLADDLLPCTTGEFEGIPVYLPARPNVVLEQIYGEYMNFPRDIGCQKHIKLFKLEQQEDTIRTFLIRKGILEEADFPFMGNDHE